jgi:hypothetical protein
VPGALHGQLAQQLVLPFQQRRTLAFALGAQVVGDRVQAVGVLGAGRALHRTGIGLAHDLHTQIHQHGRMLGCAVGLQQQLVQMHLQPARALQHQVHRHIDAGMHLAHMHLLRHLLLQLQAGAVKHAAHPALQRLFQPLAQRYVRQKEHRTFFLRHVLVKTPRQLLGMALRHGAHGLAHGRGDGVQQAGPLAGVSRMWNGHGYQ